MLNGLFATGDATSLNATKTIEGMMNAGYDNYKELRKNDECKALYTTFGCVTAVSLPDSPAAAPCSSKGTRLKICKGLCVKYIKTCSTASKTDAEVDKNCEIQTAPAGEECFGDAGVLGMKSEAHASVPPVLSIAVLALAVCLGL